ncbi:MAG TPA: ATP-dependent DNA helicase, partial [Thermoanaerobaculia bacterium]|nr:ATP-dependent DNA helicase [Thermoanaerobaculia bacterium]
WAKLTTGIGIFPRDHASAWLRFAEVTLSESAQALLDHLRANGASFLKRDEALDELIDAGLITSDGFLGRSGRWSLCCGGTTDIELQAWALLRRYGVVFRRLVAREPNAAPWRDLARIYRTLEARGEIRGGRFVTGMSGEQFALAEAVERMREIRREGNDGRLLVISAADPLNLTGIVDPVERIRATPSTRIAYRDGVAVSVMEGDFLRPLTNVDASTAMDAATALAGRRVPVASGFVGRA